MATDVQPFLNGIPSQSAHAVPDGRDRQATTQNAGASRKFESLLERAEAPHTVVKQESTSARTGTKSTSQARASDHSSVKSHKQGVDRSTASVREGRPAGQNTEAKAKSGPASDEKLDDPSAEDDTDNSDDQTTQRQDMLLAASVIPAPAVERPEVQGSPAPDSESDTSADAAGNLVSAMSVGLQETSPSLAAAMSPSVQNPGQPSVGNVSPDAAGQSSEVKKSAEKKQGSEGTIEVSELLRPDNQGVGLEASADRSDKTTQGVKIASEKIASAVVTTSKAETATLKQAAVEQPERPALLDAMSQDNSLSTGQDAASAGKFLGKESQQFPDSSAGADRTVPNQSMTNGAAERSLFLDRMNGLNQVASSPNEGASSHSETGQTASVLRAAESERMSELREASPVAQSVMLDLDPLDMGPLRVRVMISDQTVHAHIRTEHGELGQGLLQQGQSLESSLRTTGLEMGMLRVTVDQQQGRNDNAWMSQQQHQDRPTASSGQRSTPAEEERSARGETGEYRSERVSLFA